MCASVETPAPDQAASFRRRNGFLRKNGVRRRNRVCGRTSPGLREEDSSKASTGIKYKYRDRRKKPGAMAIDDSSASSFFAPWPDRLRHSAIILLAAGLALSVLVVFGELSLARAAAVFACIAAAALVPWRLRIDALPARVDVRGANPGRSRDAVSAVVAGMPDAKPKLLDRAGRVIHLNAAGRPAGACAAANELAQLRAALA